MRSYTAIVKELMVRVDAFFARRSTVGVLLAIIAYQQSLTPSLLPRTWLAQGVISGLSILFGYLIGAGLGRLARHIGIVRETLRDRLSRIRVAASWLGIAALPGFLLLSIPGRQAEWQALGFDAGDRFLYTGVIVVALVVLVVGGFVTWGCRWVYGRLFRGVSKLVPLSIAGGVTVLVTALVLVLAVNEFAYSRFMDSINATREGADTSLSDEDPERDPSRLRSGGDGSVVSWESLGREGRRFMARAPEVEVIAELSGRDAIEPIRLFVGRPAADTAAERADVAMAELERTNAFDRAVLLLVTPTGTGWVNEQVVQPLEFFYAGDTATIAMQYSHLPSPVAYLSEQGAAVDSATALLDAVRARLDEMPEDERPLLFVAGESLGAYGGTGAFANLDDLVRRVDGSMWTGTPPMSELRREAEDRRDPGSLQIRPEIARLPEIVFGGTEDDFADTTATHAFIQFSDDPTVWWDAGLLYSRPDWLTEPLDERILPQISWRPVTTFLQLTADQIVGTSFGEGFGHSYGSLPLVVWFDMLDPPGWDRERLADLREYLDERVESFHGPVP